MSINSKIRNAQHDFILFFSIFAPNFFKMKTIIPVFCLFLLIFCCAEKKTDKTMILSGTIKGLKKGTLYLQKIQDSALVTLDSLELRGDGGFSFRQELEHPQIFYLYLTKADNNELNDRITFFGEAGELKLNTQWNNFVADAKLTGSRSNKKFQELKAMLSSFNKRELELVKAGTNIDSLQLDSLNSLAVNNLRNRYRYVLNFAFTNLDSYVTPYALLSEAADANPKYLDSISKLLSTEVSKSTYGKALQAHVAQIKP